MKHWLFICSKNKWRSPTAEIVFADYPNIETDSAGLTGDAEVRLSEEQVEWADIIFVMEPIHRKKLSENFRHVLGETKVVMLGIPDHYRYMDGELIDLIKVRCAPYLGR